MRTLALCLLLLLALGCRQERAVPAGLAQDLRQRTVPDGGIATEPTPFVIKATSISTEWEVTSSLNQRDFESWLKKQLAHFGKQSDEGDSLRFAKYVDGEMQELEITIGSDSAGTTTAHVRLIVSPD